MAHLVGPTGKVVGVDHLEELVSLARENIKKNDSALLESGRIILAKGDGRFGYPAEGPYDAVGCEGVTVDKTFAS